jgi:chemotaxis protein CheX
MAEIQRQPLELNEDLVKEISFGVHSTFTSMFGLRPTPAVHVLENECTVKGDISGIIGLYQDHVEGALIVSFPLQTIFAILGKMYKREFTEVDKSVRSGVGELTNIIYGVMKTNLNKSGHGFKMAIPNVIIGSQHAIAATNPGTTLVVPFETDSGSFTVLLTLYPDHLAKPSKVA